MDETCVSSTRLWSGLFPALYYTCKTRRHPQNRKYVTYRIAVRKRPSHARPHVTRVKDLVKFGRVAFQICKRTDRHADYNTSHPYWERSNDEEHGLRRLSLQKEGGPKGGRCWPGQLDHLPFTMIRDHCCTPPLTRDVLFSKWNWFTASFYTSTLYRSLIGSRSIENGSLPPGNNHHHPADCPALFQQECSRHTHTMIRIT